MGDKGSSVLEAYDLTVNRTYKGRGALICETNQGLKILREYHGSAAKLQMQDEMLSHIGRKGFFRVDFFVHNKEGGLLTTDASGTPYVLKDCCEGKECDVKNPAELRLAAKNLALLHQAMQIPQLCTVPMYFHSIKRESEKHTRELKKIRDFIQARSKKSEFELYFIRNFNLFYGQALEVSSSMTGWDEKTFLHGIFESGQLCHGEYVHHNIMIGKQGISVINFERFLADTRVRDLYQFMRKVLEKNNWEERTGFLLLESYEEESLLLSEEKRNLYFRLAYPEKFWKVANYYYNSNKALVPDKNIDKLKTLVNQNDARERFLKQLVRY
ncbi:MAG: CotS family spore coat protein [Lachnospiraceae bacterium]